MLEVWIARVNRRPLACWDCGFESCLGHECLCVVSVVCCQLEVSVASWSLVQRSPTDCGASLCVIQKPREWGAHDPRWAAAPNEKQCGGSNCTTYTQNEFHLLLTERRRYMLCITLACIWPYYNLEYVATSCKQYDFAYSKLLCLSNYFLLYCDVTQCDFVPNIYYFRFCHCYLSRLLSVVA